MEQQVRVNNRKSLSGRVVSTKNTKTIIVAVDIYIKHPLYGKRFRKTKLNSRFTLPKEEFRNIKR